MRIRYFPIEKNLYEVSPGLRPLGTDLGWGRFDGCFFQIDDSFPEARSNKIACRKEDVEKYFVTKDLSTETHASIVRFMMCRLPQEYPEKFRLEEAPDRQILHCSHTGDRLEVNAAGDLLHFSSPEDVGPEVRDAIDALQLQVQEDIALTSRSAGKNWLSLLHLCSPSHWSARDKIGLPFTAVHMPIPGIDRVNRVADQLVDVMIHKGPFVRFVWSFVTDERLNHHPDAPPGVDPLVWKGRSFHSGANPPFYLRVERQVLFGLPEVESSLFGIRISFWSGQEIKDDGNKRQQLLGALRSMTPESRVYKGVAPCFEELVAWLEK